MKRDSLDEIADDLLTVGSTSAVGRMMPDMFSNGAERIADCRCAANQ